MSTVTTWQTFTHDSAETERIAAKLARCLRGGETIELKSDLGGGKTTFVRGLVKGLDSDDHVASPTFMISKEYASPKFRIVHFDFYRLQRAGDVVEALREAVLDDQSICVIEWGDIVDDILPTDRTIVSLERVASDENSRLIDIKTPQPYLLEGLAT